MMKSPSSQKVESSQIKGVSQRVESDTSPHSLDSYLSIRVPSAVTQHEHHVLNEEDKKEVVKNQKPGGQVQDPITAHKFKRTIRKLARFSDIVLGLLAYALSVEVVEDNVHTTYREAELSSESET